MAVNPIRVGIIEDQTDVCEGLATLIGESDGFACAGAWPSVEAAFEAYTRVQGVRQSAAG